MLTVTVISMISAQEMFSKASIVYFQVTIVGVIRDAQESATNIMYTINDMTGDDLLVRKWIDNEVG